MEEGLLPAQRLLAELLAKCCVRNQPVQLRVADLQACGPDAVLGRLDFVRRRVFGFRSRAEHLLPWIRLLVETAAARKTTPKQRPAEATLGSLMTTTTTLAPRTPPTDMVCGACKRKKSPGRLGPARPPVLLTRLLPLLCLHRCPSTAP